MRAIWVTEHGGSDRLRPDEVPQPAPGPGEVLMQVAAAGVNFVEVYVRSGLYPADLPYVPGGEAAGTVAAVGAGVSGVNVGDRVGSVACRGSYAEYAIAPADAVVRLPAGITAETAAAALLQGMTAHYLSHDSFPLGAGDTCLIHAAAGGVGRLLVQMAKRRGAIVVGTAGTAQKEALALEAGADHVIRYRDVDFAEAARSLLGARPFDVIYDSVGRDTFQAGLDLLRPRGTMVLFGQSSGGVEPLDLRVLNVKGSLFVTRPSLHHHVGTREDLQRRAGDVLGWIEAGELDVRIDAVLPLAEARAAHDRLEARSTTGKLLLAPDL